MMSMHDVIACSAMILGHEEMWTRAQGFGAILAYAI
jgi:hypothetical protein